MIKLMHCADIHGRDKDIDESEKCCEFMIATAKTSAVDLVAIAGDCFDSKDIKLDSRAAKLIIRTVSRLADIAPVVIVKGTESHDGNAPEVLQYAKGRFPVHVATRPEQILMAGAVLTLIPTPTKQYFNNGSISESNESIAQAMNGLFAGFGATAEEYPDMPHILVGHWEVTGSMLPTGQTMRTGQDISITTDQMLLANPTINVLGHIHMRQQLGDRTFYSGSLYPLNWGENTEHGFYIHTLEGRLRVSSEFIETPCRKLARYHVDETTDPPQIMDTDEMGNVSGAYVRIDITTWQDQANGIFKDRIIDQLMNDQGALDVDIRIIRKPRETVRSEVVLKAETLRDKLVAMAALNDETVSESILAKADALENTEPAKLLEVA